MATSFDYSHIPGWFDFSEIYDRMVQDAPDPAVLVEVGAWLGKSTAYLVSAVRRFGKRARVVAVDTWAGSDFDLEHQLAVRELGGDAFAHFRSNMERAGVWEDIEPIQKPSIEAAASFPDGTVDFVFLDAGHDYWSVASDIRAWWPKLRAGGWIGGHDYGMWDGVTRAVDDFFGPVEVMESSTCWLRQKDLKKPLRPAPNRPKIAVVTPHFAADPEHFQSCVYSVRDQTIPCIHYVVSDGDEPVWPKHLRNTRAVRIPGPHRDGGSAARAIGATLAAAEGCGRESGRPTRRSSSFEPITPDLARAGPVAPAGRSVPGSLPLPCSHCGRHLPSLPASR